jgi:DNA-repair protein complementing XP-A cells
MSLRPSTPPNDSPAPLPLTPEQVRRVEINRLKAKARLRESEPSASSSSAPNAHNKRPLQVTPAASTSPTAPAPLRRDNRLGNYFEYDLSKMVNSKGGFLVEDNDKHDERTRMLEQQRAEQRTAQKLDPRGCSSHEIGISACLSIVV